MKDSSLEFSIAQATSLTIFLPRILGKIAERVLKQTTSSTIHVSDSLRIASGVLIFVFLTIG
jgi:hypothetical protein